jgi:hypothetical protein
MDDVNASTPAPGAPAVVALRGGGASSDGAFRSQRAFTVTLALQSVPCVEGDDVIIACGPVGSRVAALARFLSFADGHARFARHSAWRSVDTRRHQRYRTQMRANIRRTEGNLHATVLDVSRGGIALAVHDMPGRNRFEVRVGAKHGAPYLPCRLVSASERAGETILHLSFEALDQSGTAYVESLVTELCAALEPELLAN